MNSRNVTIKDIAADVGVSARTVSLVLNGQGRISVKTRKLVLAAASRMNYQPNILARGLVNQRTYLIGVVVPYLTASFFTNILSGIEERALEQGYDILLGNSASNSTTEKAAIQRMVNRKVDGIICAPDPRHYQFYSELLRTGLPLVEIMTHIRGGKAPSVLVDDIEGGYLAGTHLVDLGHHDIGYLSYHEDFYEEITLRREGLRNALQSRRISFDLDRYEIRSDLSFDGARKATTTLIARAPELTAIVAPTDMAALGAIAACVESGRSVPGDISIVGYDDIDIARYQIAHPLTTVAQPKEQVGRVAFDLIYSLIAEKSEPESVLLKPTLVERSTTAPVRSV